jgi:hypothetical protein
MELSLFHKVEKDVKQALGVMDQKSGKMMNYPQLLKHPKFSKAWSTSLANKFGRLANGVGGHIKNPTNRIPFIHDHEVPDGFIYLGAPFCQTSFPMSHVKSTVR